MLSCAFPMHSGLLSSAARTDEQHPLQLALLTSRERSEQPPSCKARANHFSHQSTNHNHVIKRSTRTIEARRRRCPFHIRVLGQALRTSRWRKCNTRMVPLFFSLAAIFANTSFRCSTRRSEAQDFAFG